MIAINGYGKMGKTVKELSCDCWVVDPVQQGQGIVRTLQDLPSTPEVIIDFSLPAATQGLCDYAVQHGVPLVVATTGHNQQQLQCLQCAAQSIPVFVAANLSLSVYILTRCAVRVARTMSNPLITIHEIHHLSKRDAPGGTALAIARALCNACGKKGVVCGANNDTEWVGVTYQRIGDTVGVHRVELYDADQRIILSHAALDRRLFARGALAAAEFIVGQPSGLYGMQDLYAT